MPNGICCGMSTKVQVDPAGRVVLPKKIRERFRLHGGDTLILEVKEDSIELRPQKHVSQLQRVNGVLVLIGDAPLRADLVAEAREERIDDLVRGATGER